VLRGYLAIVGLTLVALGAGYSRAHAQTGPRSTRDGVYSLEQAKRGDRIYGDQCIGCHGDDMMGLDDASPLVGSMFLEKWNGRTVGELLEETRKSMPKDNPGGLPQQDFVDLVAYLLQANHFPAGAADLPRDPDQLKLVRIDPLTGH
jgi:mono/diheme cytochrome c family protein